MSGFRRLNWFGARRASQRQNRRCKKVLGSTTVRWQMQHTFYREFADEFGAALERLASAWEHDPDRRKDLIQEIHLALWRSLERWHGDCSRRTWVYRVAHNVAVTHVLRSRRDLLRSAISLDEMESRGTPMRRKPSMRSACEHACWQRSGDSHRSIAKWRSCTSKG